MSHGDTHGVTAREIMHPGAECIGEHHTLDRAAMMMRDMNVGALPVCGADDRLKGIVTDRDIVVGCIAQGRDPATVTAGEMCTGLVWIEADATVEEALQKMESHQIRRLPVLEDRRIVGMITEADLARRLPENKLAEFVERVYAG